MISKVDFAASSQVSHSILAFSQGATAAFRLFSKEDFLLMMSVMSEEEILSDLQEFKDLEEYEICTKLKFVIAEKRKLESVNINVLTCLL